MGYGIDPRFAPRKLRWHWSSRGPRMLAAAAGGGGSRFTTRRRMADGFFGRASGTVPEGRVRLKEMVRGIGQAGSP
jgi:hypothetical protein